MLDNNHDYDDDDYRKYHTINYGCWIGMYWYKTAWRFFISVNPRHPLSCNINTWHKHEQWTGTFVRMRDVKRRINEASTTITNATLIINHYETILPRQTLILPYYFCLSNILFIKMYIHLVEWNVPRKEELLTVITYDICRCKW